MVGKFYSAYPAATPADPGLVQEYHHYLRAAALGLTDDPARIPRLLGRRPDLRLGLLLEAVPGPDLDRLVRRGRLDRTRWPTSFGAWKAWLNSWPFFTPAPAGGRGVGPEALSYLDKLWCNCTRQGLLTGEDEADLDSRRAAWEVRLAQFPDRQVLVHGDATPTNFLFPEGRAVALDLERLRPATASGTSPGWPANSNTPGPGAPARRPRPKQPSATFSGPIWGPQPDPGPGRTPFLLNPFYMALAELRIARNAYLAWDYRRWLVAEATRCLTYGRRL